MKKIAFFFVSVMLPLTGFAKPVFTGENFSGTYECTGLDDHEGKYTGIVTLELIAQQSVGAYGAYKFSLEVPGFGLYVGQAAANGMTMAIHFALTDPTTKDYGTGIANFSKGAKGKWRFHKYYYEPEFKGGNFGLEDCMAR